MSLNKIRINSASRVIPVSILLISFLIGLIYIICFSRDEVFYYDYRRYDSLAMNLISGKGYLEKDDTVIQSPPLYPIFLAGIYYVFGHDYFPVKVFQVILNSLSALLIFLIAKKVFNGKIAFLAGIISSLYPSFILFTGVILSENLFVFLILLSVFLWLRSIGDLGIGSYVLLGIVLGLATLTRPVALLIPGLVFLSLLIFKEKNIISKVCVLILVFLLVNSPWVIRNYFRYKAFIPTTIGGGASLYIASINWDGKIVLDKKMNYVGKLSKFQDLGRGLLPLEKDKMYRKEAWKNISEHPFKCIGSFPQKLLKFYIRPAGYGQLGGIGEGILKKVCFLIVYSLILFFCLLGSIFVLLRKEKLALILLSVIGYFTFIHMLISPYDPRYHLPAMPFIITLSSFGIFCLKRLIFPQKKV